MKFTGIRRDMINIIKVQNLMSTFLSCKIKLKFAADFKLGASILKVRFYTRRTVNNRNYRALEILREYLH